MAIPTSFKERVKLTWRFIKANYEGSPTPLAFHLGLRECSTSLMVLNLVQERGTSSGYELFKAFVQKYPDHRTRLGLTPGEFTVVTMMEVIDALKDNGLVIREEKYDQGKDRFRVLYSITNRGASIFWN